MKYFKSKVGLIVASVYALIILWAGYSEIYACSGDCGMGIFILTMPSILITSPLFEIIGENFAWYLPVNFGLAMILNSVILYFVVNLIESVIRGGKPSQG